MVFTNSIYTTIETNEGVYVCVLLSGSLGVNITLQLDTFDGTAQSETIVI